ncbi:MAG: ROK family protein [Deinococcota bacterium]
MDSASPSPSASSTSAPVLGIDIGGSGIKGAPVNVDLGELASERLRIPTPQPSTPDAVAGVVAEIVQHFAWQGPIGCTFPAIVKHGVIHSAANVDQEWIGEDAGSRFTQSTGQPTTILNDADAAGIAEMTLGAGRNQAGVVFVLTFGTGIGSALFIDGTLVPNTELGHLELDGHDAETRAAARVRKEEDLSWKKWAKRVDRYLQHVEFLFSPDLFIIGGGVSKKPEKFFDDLTLDTKIVPAELQNEAGIIGAAMAVSSHAVD